MSNVVSRYTVGLRVRDQLGVLAAIANVFAEHGVSIQTMHQTKHREHEDIEGNHATIRIVTHKTSDENLQSTIDELSSLSTVYSVASVIQVEG